MKQALVDKVSIFLLKEGYTIRSLTRTCFDLLARKNEQILLIKVLEDANSISREYSEEMDKISSYISASPLIVSDKAGNFLDDNVVYARFGIHTLNLRTFINCINDRLPFIIRSQAGLTAHIVGKKLKEKREQEGYSLASLSKKIGVTRRMIIKYENENSKVTVNRAMKLYDLFGHQVFSQVDVFSQQQGQVKPESQIEKVQRGIDGKKSGVFQVSKKYSDLGFRASRTKKTPFDIIAKKGKDVILTEVGDKVNPQMQSLSRLLDADNLVIFKKKKPKNMPSLTKKEFMDFAKADELVRFLKEY